MKRQPSVIDTGYYWYLNKCLFDLQSSYKTSRQNKKGENLDINASLMHVNFNANYVKFHLTANSCRSMSFFASLFFINDFL